LKEGVIIRALSLPFTRNLFPRSLEQRVTVHSRNRLNRYRPCAIMRAKCPIEVNNVCHNGDVAYMTATRGERRRLRKSVMTSPFSFTVILTFIYRTARSRNIEVLKGNSGRVKAARTIALTEIEFK